MAKNSRRAAAALQTVIPGLKSLDALPPLKSLALTVFFNTNGDVTNVTPRWDVDTDQAHLTASAEPPT